uniref:Haem-binding uptake Tiki superfamily ChaN domain-containing protein n=1 Tax=Thermodesulfobacterium geofontis TaxID=1295609 RepID=A0A7V4N379_9BACT
MRLFTYILFFWILFLPNLSLGTPLLKIDLELYPELNLLKGSLFTDNLNGEYKFITSDLTINEVQTSSEVLLFEQEEFLKIFTKEESSLYISFEKNLNPYLLPITIVHPPFPYPGKPFTYQINLKIPDTFENMEILIPSEESKIERDKNFLLYTFKTQNPLLNPCIIISPFKLEKMKFSYKNFSFYFYYSPQLYTLSEKDLKKIFENFKTFAYHLENIGIFLHPFKIFHLILVPEDFPKVKSFSNVLFISYSSLKDTKQFLHCLTKKKLEDEILLEEEIKEGLITYLIDYQLAENKKDFRKLQILFPKKESKAFFYFLFLAERIGEKNFINFFKKFYEKSIFNFRSLNDFLILIQQSYPEFKNFIISYEEFQKLNLRGEVKSIIQEKDFYLLDLTLYTNLASKNLVKSIPISLEIETEKGSKFVVLNLEKETQDFQISVNGKPEVIFIDPEYKLWRNLDFEEIPNCIAKLFYSQGTIILKKDDLPTYKKFIDYFRNLGYKISFSFIEFSEISKIFENLIYLNISPLTWQFNPPSEGFYLKVIPNPYNSEYIIGYLHVSSQNELDEALKNLVSLNPYSEIFIRSGKVILKREDKTFEGIPIFIPLFSEETCIKSNFSFREEALKYINSQIILAGIEKEIPFCKDYLKNLLQSLYNFNRNIILALDLPPFFQRLLEDYFENKLSEFQLKESLKNIDYIHVKALLEVIEWAKMNKIKVLTIGVDPELFLKILNNGLKGLSQKDLSKLPEIDFLNPPYKDYLFSLFVASENLQKFNFENFYEAQVFRLEDLSEKIKKLLETFKSNQFIIFIQKDLITQNWKLPYYLQKRNILNFKIINPINKDIKSIEY